MEELIEVRSNEDVEKTAALAYEIWNEHFPAIIGQEQVNYMVSKFQSADAISQQLDEGFMYFLIATQGESAGYLAIQRQAGMKNSILNDSRCVDSALTEDGSASVQLSKLYLRKQFRRQGIARRVLEMIKQQLSDQGISLLWLTVNKYNEGAITAYERLGFVRQGELVIDIGGSYVMDDYRMALSF